MTSIIATVDEGSSGCRGGVIRGSYEDLLQKDTFEVADAVYEWKSIIQQLQGNGALFLEAEEPKQVTSVKGVQALCQAMKEEKITSFGLTNYTFSEKAWEALCVGLCSYTKPKELLFEANSLSVDNLANLASAVYTLNQLTSFTFVGPKGGNGTDIEFCQAVGTLLFSLPDSLESLKLSDFPADPEVLFGLKETYPVKKLHLVNVKISDENADYFFENNGKKRKREDSYRFPNLENFSLRDNQLKSMSWVRAAIEHPSFREVDLSGNTIPLAALPCDVRRREAELTFHLFPQFADSDVTRADLTQRLAELNVKASIILEYLDWEDLLTDSAIPFEISLKKWELVFPDLFQDCYLMLEPDEKLKISSATGVRALCQVIDNKGCKVLRFTRSSWEMPTWNMFCEALKGTLVTDLYFDFCEISPDQLAMLPQELFDHVTILSVRGTCNRSHVGVLANILAISKLTQLDVSRCAFNEDDIEQLFSRGRKYPLKILVAESNHIWNEARLVRMIDDGAEIGDDDNDETPVGCLGNLRGLDLSNNRILGLDLLKCILQRKDFNHLHLDHNQISQENFETFLREIPQLKVVKCERDIALFPQQKEVELPIRLIPKIQEALVPFGVQRPVFYEDEEDLMDEGEVLPKELEAFKQEILTADPVEPIIERMNAMDRERFKPILFRTLLERYFKIVEVRNDGNCLFESVGKAVGKSPDVIRKEALDYLKENRASFEMWFGSETLDNYAERMSKNGEWGDQIMMMVLADYLGRFLIVFNEENRICLENGLPMPVDGRYGDPSKPKLFIYNRHLLHFEYLEKL